MIDFKTPHIITVNTSDIEGNTVWAAAMDVFGLKNQSEVKPATYSSAISVLLEAKWVDFDFWVTDTGFKFLLAY